MMSMQNASERKESIQSFSFIVMNCTFTKSMCSDFPARTNYLHMQTSGVSFTFEDESSLDSCGFFLESRMVFIHCSKELLISMSRKNFSYLISRQLSVMQTCCASGMWSCMKGLSGCDRSWQVSQRLSSEDSDCRRSDNSLPSHL